jgi:hypothetical protein
MHCPTYILENGTKIRTHATLEPTTGMMIGPGNLSMRKPSADGVIRGVVGGHGGDVYWVHHEGSVLLAPYCYTEFEPV